MCGIYIRVLTRNLEGDSVEITQLHLIPTFSDKAINPGRCVEPAVKTVVKIPDSSIWAPEFGY